MGTRGPRPKPQENEVGLPPLPQPSSRLPAAARAVYRDCVSKLTAAGIGRSPDEAMLERYCVITLEERKLTKFLARVGYTYRARGLHISMPQVAIREHLR